MPHEIPHLRPRLTGSRVAFYGKMCSGKTYCAKYLINHGYATRVALADKLKAIAYDLYGLQGKDGHSRALLQGLGDDLRKWDEDVFIKSVLRKVQAIETQKYPPKIVVDDVRFVNEAVALLSAGFTLIEVQCREDLRLERIKSLYPSTDAAALNHASELQIKEIKDLLGFEYVLSNEPADLIYLDKYL